MAEENGVAEDRYKDVLVEEGIAILSGLKDVEIDPNELDLLFNCDNPLALDKPQRAVIVEGLRRARAKYLTNKKAKAAKKAAKATPAEIEGMSLDDLQLDLTDLVKE